MSLYNCVHQEKDIKISNENICAQWHIEDIY